MSVTIQIRHDRKRGCGWRQPGGLYLIAAGVSAPCGLLPIPLSKCPTCSCGIKPSRGWTWVDVATLTKGRDCTITPPSACSSCPLSSEEIYNGGAKQGLLWIGGSFYAKPSDWTDEAIKQGISRRLSAVPRDFELGKTWVLVAHQKAMTAPCPDCAVGPCETCGDTRIVPQAAIFHAFRPTAIEYVVRGTETEEELQRLVDRGITPVKIERQDSELFPEEEDDDEATPVAEEEDETTVSMNMSLF